MTNIRKLLMIAVFLFLFAININAHTLQSGVNIDDYIGDENIGWVLTTLDGYYVHNSSYNNTLTYRFHNNPSSDYPLDNFSSVNMGIRTIFNESAEKWNDVRYNSLKVATLNEIASSASIIDVMQYNAIDGTAAYVNVISTELIGESHKHITKAILIINNSYIDDSSDPDVINQNIGTLAHEIGHVIGLKDLESNNNKNKLMYYQVELRTVHDIQPADIKGAAVVSGVHANHIAGSYVSLSEGHYGVCSYCDHDMPYTAHTLSAPYTKVDATYHSALCSDCQNTGKEVHSEGTPSYWTSTYHIATCSKCGNSNYYNHGGSFSSINSESHQKYCSSCSTTITQSHSKSYGTVSIAHSTTNNGHAQTVSCAACGWSTTDYVPGGSSCLICNPPHAHTWGPTQWSATHPHPGTQSCTGSGCNATQSVGNYSGKYPGCSTCNPPPQHTHSYTNGHVSSHPHENYKTCTSQTGTCDARTVYLGTYYTDPTCLQCHTNHTYGSWVSIDYMYHRKTCTFSGCGNYINGTHSLSTNRVNVGSSSVCQNSVTTCSSCTYYSSVPLSHSYTNNCDPSCNNNCGVPNRSVTHNFYVPYRVIVGSLNICYEMHKQCYTCGLTEKVSTMNSHTYDNISDKICNICSFRRA